MRVLVCGGRDFTNRRFVYKTLEQFCHDREFITVIIHGGARGADTLAAEWAGGHGITRKRYNANWNKYGKMAGPIRNQQMLDEGKPDIVIAFPGGKGTADMVKRAKRNGIEVIDYGV